MPDCSGLLSRSSWLLIIGRRARWARLIAGRIVISVAISTIRTSGSAAALALAEATLAVRSAGPAWASATSRRRAQFVHGQFSVAVFVEFLERFGGVRHFVGIDDAVTIGVQSHD